MNTGGCNRPKKRARLDLLVLLLYGAMQPACALAQGPLNIDALTPADSELTLQMGYSFLAASDHKLIPLTPTHSGEVANLPVVQAILEREIESAQWTSALRYGLNTSLELRGTLRERESRIRAPYQPSSTYRSTALALGGTWLVSRDSRTPALLVSLDMDVASRSPLKDSKVGYGKAFRLNTLIYRSLDPVVLSVQAGIELFSSWRSNQVEYDRGSNASVKSQISFAVNPEVTLIGGLTVQRSQPSELSKSEVFDSATRISLTMAGGLALSRRSSLFLGTDVAATGSNTASINLEWLYQFNL